MKRTIALFACVFALTACNSQSESDTAATSASAGNESAASTEAASSAEAGFENAAAKRSYALGMDIGNSLKALPVELNVDALAEGVRDTITGGETRLTQEELQAVMQSFVQDMQTAQREQAQQTAQANLKAGKEFLAENKTKEGVQATESGLQYKVLTEGSGPSPDANDSVTVHYEGRLIDGTVFDSSRERGEPVTFPVDAVIPGWTEALQLMQEGATYMLYIPPELAYGERGAGAQIGPNETLVFEVELLKVNAKEGGASGDAAGSSAGAQSGRGQDEIQSESAGAAMDIQGSSGSEEGSASE